jgi:hypothetical protein
MQLFRTIYYSITYKICITMHGSVNVKSIYLGLKVYAPEPPLPKKKKKLLGTKRQKKFSQFQKSQRNL